MKTWQHRRIEFDKSGIVAFSGRNFFPWATSSVASNKESALYRPSSNRMRLAAMVDAA